jgi:hypothetical protein
VWFDFAFCSVLHARKRASLDCRTRDGDHLDMLGKFTSIHSKYISTLPTMSSGLTSLMALNSLYSGSVNAVQDFGDVEPCLVLDILGRGIIMVVPSFAVI